MLVSDQVSAADAKLARAIELNKAMVTLGLEREGLARTSAASLALLRGASLVELSEAGRIVKAFEAARPANADGARSFSLVCDDRLVAAIYAFLHFTLPPASSPHDEDYLILKLTDTTHTYFLISGAREAGQEQDEDEPEAEAA
jgi:hypothetical protein